jgi:hypothetical protein
MPAIFSHIYQDFLELNAARGSNGYSPNPISFAEIQAFYSLSQLQPAPWEVFILRYFDSLFIRIYEEEQAKKAK